MSDSLQQSQAELKRLFLPAIRQRFKAEINRLTGGDMVRMLGNNPHAQELGFLLSYVYCYHWLRHHVHEAYREEMLAAFRRGKQGFLMELLLQADDHRQFIRGYIDHWLQSAESSTIQRQQIVQLLAADNNQPEQLTNHIAEIWNDLQLFQKPPAIAYKNLAREERNRYGDMLGEADLQRLAMVDALPDLPGKHPGFAKLGLIPAMGCPQTCRHCMFIWRPLIKDTPDPGQLFSLLNQFTDSVLFTGGDLTRHLHHFNAAIRSMRNITTFAILLNGDFATDRQITDQTLQEMAQAIKNRPSHWPRANILLQISFDEFHQEVMVDKKGQLKERIPVRKIANIVETVANYGNQMQLCLLHKQHGLNFSMELFSKGVFGRLAEELGRRGHQIQILSTGGSRRLKKNPLDPKNAPGAILKDASFVLTRYPEHPILLTSSTIDAYGRAELLDESESVKDRDLLHRVLQTGDAEGEFFDTDLMFWFNGWTTLFSAVHLCLGNVYEDGLDTILQRQRKDPLSIALHHFDRRLLGYYSEIRTDLQQLIGKSTGPHHLFHQLTEDAQVRLHMTRRLIEDLAVS
jgi:hypothetical protein